MKPMFKMTCMKILVPVLALAASTAYADPPADKGKPDKADKTDQLVRDAMAICGGEAGSPTAACNLLIATDGHHGEGQGKCDPEDDTGDPNLVYSGRNCDRNEETLLRDAASIVIEIHDAMVIAPDQGDESLPKWCQALSSLSSYSATFYELIQEEKLTGDDAIAGIKGDIGAVLSAIKAGLDGNDCATS